MAKSIPVELTPRQFESLQNTLDRAGQFISEWLEDAQNGTAAEDYATAQKAKKEYLDCCYATLCEPVDLSEFEE